MMAIATFFLLGLSFGSFFNVVINRLPQNKSIVFPPSHCPNCEYELKFLDLIPILSYIFLKGKCRNCEDKIHWQYPMVELFTGFYFVLTYTYFDSYFNIFFFLIFFSLLFLASIIDIKHKIIPNKINFLGVIIALIFAVFGDGLEIYESILGVLIPFAFFLLLAIIFKGKLGFGDVKFIALIGAFLGFEKTFVVIFLASTIALITSIIYGIIKKDLRFKIPFGPFLALGAVIMSLFSEEIFRLLNLWF